MICALFRHLFMTTGKGESYTRSMPDLKRFFVFIVPISFIFGVWWGLKLIHLRQAADAQTLKMLTFRGLLDAPLIDDLKKEKVNLQLVQVDSTEQWRKALESEGPFDLLAPMSFQIETLIGSDLLAPLPDLPVLKRRVIAADFLGLPFDPQDRYTLPLFWGTDSSIFSPEGSSEAQPKDVRIWLQMLAVDNRSPHREKAFSILKHFTNSQAIQTLVAGHLQASPFRIVENSSLHRNRKPSYLRTLPLSRLKFYQLSSTKNLELSWSPAAKNPPK